MKKYTLIYLLSIFGQFGIAQTTKKADPNRTFYNINTSKFEGFGLNLQVDSTTKRINYHNPIPNQPYNNLVYLEGTKIVKILGYIHPDSLYFYRYSIVENDAKQIVTDAIPNIKNPSPFFNTSRQIELNLGSYNIKNKKITISYYKTTRRAIIATIIIYNKKLAPAKLEGVFIEKFIKGGSAVDMENKMNLTNFTFNQYTKSILLEIENVELDYLYTATLKEKSTGKVLFSSNMWSYDFFVPRFPFLHIDKEYLKKEGDYEISIVPKLSIPLYVKPLPVKPLVYSFSVKYEKSNLFTKKELISYILYSIAVLGLIFGFIIIFIKRKNKAKFLAVEQQNQIAKLQLNSIRSQLNPHFLFNTLAGIQNLINKSDIENANQYLTRFARLTRNVLDNKELISLKEEKLLLDDYLQMEQLRFGFQYLINITADLDTENIEIPAMLLQPFVENAVKHGIAEMSDDGKIDIAFKKQGSDLVLEVSDNGKGFDASKTYQGLGLALSKNRITLLNSIYKNTPFVLDILSNKNGTTITITLKQWL